MSDKRTVKFNKEVPENAGRTAKRLFGQLKNQRGRLSIVAVCIVLYTVLNIFTPYYSAGVIYNLLGTIRNAMDTGAGFSIPWNPLGSKMLTLFLMYLLTGVFYHLQAYLMASVAERLILTLRKQISNKLNKLPLRLFDGNKPGEILSRVTSDLDKVSETLQTGLLKLLTAIGTLIGAMAFMFYYSPLLTVVFLVFAVVSLLVTKVVAKKNLECAADRQRALAYLTGIAEEYYTGRDVIRAYNHEQESIETINTAVDELRAATKKTDFLTNCVNPLIRLLSRLSQAVIMLLACHWMLQGRMSLGVVQAFFQYVNMASEPLTETSYMLNSLQSALASAERTFYFLDAKEEVPETALPAVLEKARGKISFENVSFGYSSDKILMKNISFTAKPGQKIAVVGSTGAGKTTLIKKLLKEAFQNEQVVLIENEFGEIGIDGGFLKEAGVEIREMNSGCICCSLVGDFGTSLKEVIETYHPDRILIEPSGVGKLSDVIKAVENVKDSVDIVLNSYTTVVDVNKCKLYLKNFGEFYSNQVETAGAIILSRTDVAKEGKAEEAVKMLREMNANAAIITTPIEQLDGAKILETMEHVDSLEKQMLEEELRHQHEHEHHHEHEHDHEHDEDCTCGCHDHDHDEHEHHHDHDEHEHHHAHDKHEHDHEHDHHHEHDENCTCGCHDHDHHHHGHHHADDVFSSWGKETVKKFNKEELKVKLAALDAADTYGVVLRAKGMVAGDDGQWIYFDMVPGEQEVRTGEPEFTGRICVIGSELKEDALA